MNAENTSNDALQNDYTKIKNPPHLVGDQLEEDTPLVLNTGNIVFSNQETSESEVPSFFEASSSTIQLTETNDSLVDNLLSAEVTCNDTTEPQDIDLSNTGRIYYLLLNIFKIML